MFIRWRAICEATRDFNNVLNLKLYISMIIYLLRSVFFPKEQFSRMARTVNVSRLGNYESST